MPRVASALSPQNVTDVLCVAPISGEKCADAGKSIGCVAAVHVDSNVTRYRAVAGATGAGAGVGAGVDAAVTPAAGDGEAGVADEHAEHAQHADVNATAASSVPGEGCLHM